MAKIDVFLKDINLYKLYNENRDDVERMLTYNFNYIHINEIIDKKREKSIEFLRKACDV